jgi:formate transporter
MSDIKFPLVDDALDPSQMAYKGEAVMEGKAKKAPGAAFLLAVMAGLFIGVGFVYCAIAEVNGAGKIVGGLAFSMGLMLVVIFGADLFTGSTMTLIAKAGKKITWGRLLSNWGFVYAGNLAGALILAAIIMLSGHPWENGGAIGIFYINTAAHKLSHTFIEAFFLGVVCNLMVCLAVWTSFAGRSVLDKMLACLFPVGMFIAGGFEHSIANMFMIPSGIIVYHSAPAEVMARVAHPERLAELLTVGNFIVKNLIPVTLGNIIGGGVMVGLFHWLIYLRPGVARR